MMFDDMEQLGARACEAELVLKLWKKNLIENGSFR